MSRTSSTKQVKHKIERLVPDLNQAWLKKRFRELEKYLHENVIMVQPGFQQQLREREACIRSYKGFMEHSKVANYKESGYMVDSWENVTVASYKFDIRYTTKGERYHDVGRDVFVLIRDRGNWRAIWRTLVSFES